MADAHHSNHHPHHNGKESAGELQVTVIAGRNLRSDGKSEVAYCSIDLPGNKTARTSSNKNKEPVWNESFNFDLMSLDNDEVLIQVFGKRRISTDKFLGQIQIPIKGLSLSKDIAWYYLTDKPKNPHELPEHMRVDPTLSPPRKMTLSSSNPKIKERVKSPHKEKEDKKKGKEEKEKEKEDKTYITGEISVRLNFTHRFLLKGKSKNDVLVESEINSPHASTPVSPSSSSRPRVPTLTLETNGSRPGLDIGSPRKDSEGAKTLPVPKLVLAPAREASSPPTSPPTSPHRKEPEKQVSFPSASTTTPRNSTANLDEAKAIETAYREKLQLVKQKLREKRELIGLLQTNVNLLKNQPDQEQFNIEMHKLNEMQRELTELEKLEKEFTESLDNTTSRKTPISSTQSVRNIDRTKSRAQMREKRSTRSFENGIMGGGMEMNRRGSKRFDSIGSLDPDSFVDETKYLRHRVASLETDLMHERKMSDLVNSKNLLLEKETKRLEEELQKVQYGNDMRDKELEKVKLECERLNREVKRLNGENGTDLRSSLSISIPSTPVSIPSYALDSAAGRFLDASFRDGTESAYEAIKKICGEVKSISKEGKDEIEAQRREIEDQLRGVELSIERHMMMQKRVEVDTMSRKLVKKQEMLSQLEQKHKRKDGNSEGDYTDEYDEESEDEDMKTPTASGTSDAKLDMLVVKLEKLDKLDELLKKIDNMKYASPSYGGDSQGEQSRNYDDLKKELEEFQKIIVDETGKYTEREKEEANIKYEKVFTELSQTKQYKAEVAQQLEEKRRANEPLNKAALEKMIKVYSAENLRNDPNLRDKVLKNPELSLIGLDPKAILAKHQNDFSQYLLRLTDIDELRAVRASLPKFRPDQKRQLEWVEVLETKIEAVAKSPPKKPAPPKPPSAKSWKPKPPPKNGAPPTDMFAELLAKRKKVDEQEDDSSSASASASTVSSPRLSSTSSLSSSSSSSVDPRPSTPSSLSSESATDNPGSVRGKLKLAPTKQTLSSSSANATSLGRSSGMSAAPPPPPPPPISF